ncbi:MAG: carboxypeptidase-like regulatory domain-containing protein, partial [Bacteroidota bacterium]
MTIRLMLLVFTVFFAFSASAFSQDMRTVSGMVIDSLTGEPIAGASIRAEGRTTGTYTDRRGTFKLPVPKQTEHLIVRSIGYRERRYDVPEVTTTVRIQLASAGVSLRGVNVVADITP